MRGNILEYTPHTDQGLISAMDGKRYTFSRSAIRNQSMPIKGMEVDFEPADGVATDIIPIIRKSRSGVSRVGYIILGLFFGLLGVHNFYAGRNGVGAAQLFISLFGIILAGIPTIMVGIWVLIELIAVSTDGSGKPMS